MSVSRIARYTASLADKNKTINCYVSQVHSTNLLLDQTIVLVLKISQRKLPAPLVRQVPFLSGILLLVIFLLLSCILLSLLIVRLRKKDKIRRELKRGESQNSPLVLYGEGLEPRWKTEHYKNGDIFTEIADVTKPLSSTYRETFNNTNFSSFHGKSPSVSDMASLYSHEDVTVIDNPFNPGDFAPIPSQLEPIYTSVPQLYKRRSSIPARILINPTSFPPPHSAKSLGHLNSCNDQCQASQRRRRKTAPASSKSSHSVFDCDEGCFDVEDVHKSQQMVFISTGPMVI